MINKENRVVENYDEDIQELIEETKCKFMFPVVDLQRKTNSEKLKRKLEVICIYDIDNIALDWEGYIYAHADSINKVYYAEKKGFTIAITDKDILVYGERLQFLFSAGNLVANITKGYLNRINNSYIKEADREAFMDEIIDLIVDIFGEIE